MPLVRIDTNQTLSAAEGQGLCEKVSRLTAEVMGKPEKYVQVVLHAGELGVDGARVYLNFTDVSASSWGHDGTTFG